MSATIKDLPENQRPYEKCMLEGEGALSDSELLAVILRSGTRDQSSLALANEVLRLTRETAYPGLPGLFHLSLEELTRIHGIGKVKAVQLKCIGELAKRIACANARPQVSFHDPQSIAAYYMEKLRHEEQELLYCMMMDGNGHFLGDELISKGTVNCAPVSPREIFITAMKYRAVAIVLVHNHPSGNPQPSGPDVEVTERIQRAGEILGIELLDHIIIGDHRFCSLKCQGFFDGFA